MRDLGERTQAAEVFSRRINNRRFIGGVAAVYLFFALLLLALKAVFLWANWMPLQEAGHAWIGRALWQGLRFEAATLGYLLAPVVPLLLVSAATRQRLWRWLLWAYLAALAVLVPLVCLADLQYFAEAGKHLTYEATVYFNRSGIPIVLSAFAAQPALSWISLLACLALAGVSAWFFRLLLGWCLPPEGARLSVVSLLLIPVWAAWSILSIRGGWQGRPLQIGHSSISPNPYINALCLDPVYSVLRSLTTSSKAEYQFYNEKSNARTTLHLLLGEDRAPDQEDYPLLRTSRGSASGNRKNVVLFILESWSGKDVGILGGPPGVTPFFDNLARQGAFFDHFYAAGIRSSEGIFSTLASFPNQPLKAIMHRPFVLQVHWRTLSQILGEAGYDNIFVHGRDINFDNMGTMLKAIGFQRVIDRDGFPPSAPRFDGEWPGYDDEEVMRRAHEEFARQKGRPFLGVIYTMNTHPPFVTPKSHPLLFEPVNSSSQFLNSLNYSDYTLKVFFELATKETYFQDTVFIFVADHARTRDTFNLDSQHRIPFLIYSPGYVPAALHPVVGGQLDILPTVLGLLQLQTRHAAWGQDLLNIPEERGFSVSVAGNDIRWHEGRYLLHDALTGEHPLLFDLLADPGCKTDTWLRNTGVGEALQKKLRAWLSLSQTLMYEDRVYPRRPGEIGARQR